MFIGSFLIQYFLMSYIMTNSISDIRSSRGKIYMSLIMASLMSLLEILMHDIYNFSFNFSYYIIFIIILIVLVLLYKKQYFINDKNYIEEMIEHHSMAILTSNGIINKTNDEKIKKFANKIISIQEKEINEMKDIINDKDIINNKKENPNIEINKENNEVIFKNIKNTTNTANVEDIQKKIL